MLSAIESDAALVQFFTLTSVIVLLGESWSQSIDAAADFAAAGDDGDDFGDDFDNDEDDLDDEVENSSSPPSISLCGIERKISGILLALDSGAMTWHPYSTLVPLPAAISSAIFMRALHPESICLAHSLYQINN